MSFTSNFILNQRTSYLESEISKIAPIPPGGYSLENVLDIGNNTGSNDINLNNNDLLNVDNITSSGNLIIDPSNNLIVKKQTYQELNTDPSWNSVNGYYGLAKDAYPALNPYSSGVVAVSTWNTRNSAADNAWNSVCWSPENKIFVAVSFTGTTNRVMTSFNGVNWDIRTAANNNEWRSVCWAPELGLFVAVSFFGPGDLVMTSPNGVSWTSRVAAVYNNWSSVCWSPELGLLVAVSGDGSGDRVMTSPDGIVWTSRTSAADNVWETVCWAPELGLFVAVASSGTGDRVMTSPDGIVWTSRTSAADNQWFDVCWAPELGLFVAVASSGIDNRVMTSPNGINWTIRTSAANIGWNGVCWSPELGLFVAVAFTGTGNRVMTSPNGINWTIRTSAADNQWSSVCWSPELGLFVAVASSGTGNRVMTSNLAGRPPTSYNVFDNTFNRIDANGIWDMTVTKLRIIGNNQNLEWPVPFASGVAGDGRTLICDGPVHQLTFNPGLDRLSVPSFRSSVDITLTDGINTKILTPTSIPATTVDVIDNNVTGVFYPVYVDGAGNTKVLGVDSLTGPLTYTPLGSILAASTFQASGLVSTPILVVSTRVSFPDILTTASYAGTTLTLDVPAGNNSFNNFNFTLTGNITTLTLSNFRTGGIYKLFITGNATTPYTISEGGVSGLGSNIYTNYSTPVTINANSKSLFEISYDGTTYYLILYPNLTG